MFGQDIIRIYLQVGCTTVPPRLEGTLFFARPPWTSVSRSARRCQSAKPPTTRPAQESVDFRTVPRAQPINLALRMTSIPTGRKRSSASLAHSHLRQARGLNLESRILLVVIFLPCCGYVLLS